MSSIFTLTFLTGLIVATLRILPPLLLGATGEMFSERCGLTNIGLEGIMSVGAIVGFIVSYLTGNPYLAMAAGVAAGWAFNMIYAFLTINLNADQVIVGNAMNILGLAVASLCYTTVSKSQAGVLSKVEVIMKLERFESFKRAMNEIGVTGMTVSKVAGCGMQLGQSEYYRGSQMEINLLPKLKVEIVLAKVPVELVVNTTRKVLYTGHIGDGKIFVYDVRNVVKVRTGEVDYEAMQGTTE